MKVPTPLLKSALPLLASAALASAASAQRVCDQLLPPTSERDLPAVHGSLAGYPTAGDVGFAGRPHRADLYTAYEIASGISACVPSRARIAAAEVRHEEAGNHALGSETGASRPSGAVPPAGSAASLPRSSAFAKTGVDVVPLLPPGGGDLR